MLISAVGSDPWAGPVRAELDRLGIHFLDLAAGTAYETPLCTVLVSAANSTRTIVNPPLTKVELCSPAPTWEDAVPSSWGAPPPVALVDGFFLPETLPLLTSLHAAGTCICLDAGSWKPGSGELAPLLSVAICSERFTIPGLDAGPDSLFAWFAARGVPFVAITRGARSILASDRGRRFEIEIEPIFTTDTLGAGDVLHGAFCHHFALAPEFEPALRKAAALATLSCKSIGIEGWVSEAKVSRS
jgi:sugar/nucleoside kinase (ribokinase family)